MKTRITLVAAGVIRIGRFGRVQLGDRVWQVTFNAPRSRPELDRGNLLITLTSVATNEEVQIQAWLAPEGWRFGEIAGDGAQPSAAAQDHPEPHMHWHADRFRDLLLQRLLTPFKYEENLEGDEAHEFFGPVGSRHKLQLAVLQGLPLLLTEGW